jgi:uncharacterized Zn-binding protein involved in type VI secretion
MDCRSIVAVGVALRAVFATSPEPALIPPIDREGDRTACNTCHSHSIHTGQKLNQINGLHQPT